MNYEILVGDVFDGLAQLADNSVQVVVTSPPYFGLRRYIDDDAPEKQFEIGLEPTLDEFLAKMVAVFREVRRVLRPDGTCWLNIGDSYVNNPASAVNRNGMSGSLNNGQSEFACRIATRGSQHRKSIPAGLKPKDLMLVPFRLAIALQADGWFVRSDIIWQKPNPMPESCTDRPTTAHEHIFLLTKSGKYYYDQYATREKADYDGRKDTQMKGSEKYSDAICPGNQPQTFALRGHERWPNTTDDGERGRNSRSVWSIATYAFSEAHFAVYPPELVRRCLLAGLPKHGSCPKCGNGWVRKVETSYDKGNRSGHQGYAARGGANGMVDMSANPRMDKHEKSLGHEPDCDCGLAPVPAVVLDPFSGSGTTGVVALKMGARYIGIELSPEYAEMSRKRIEREAGGLFS